MTEWLSAKRESLPPRTTQLVGLVGFVGMLVFWMVTSRLSVPLLTATGGLIGFGRFADAVRALPSVATEDQP